MLRSKVIVCIVGRNGQNCWQLVHWSVGRDATYRSALRVLRIYLYSMISKPRTRSKKLPKNASTILKVVFTLIITMLTILTFPPLHRFHSPEPPELDSTTLQTSHIPTRRHHRYIFRPTTEDNTGRML